MCLYLNQANSDSLFLSVFLQPLGFCVLGAKARGVGRSRHSQCWSEALSLLQWRASRTQLVRYELSDSLDLTAVMFKVLYTAHKTTDHATTSVLGTHTVLGKVNFA